MNANPQRLLEYNRRWAEMARKHDREYFASVAETHDPSILWVGCCDARFPAEIITGAALGEMFVLRNIGNQVDPNDTNTQAALKYAIDTLKVEHIIVCGHYNCGAVFESRNEHEGVIDEWLDPIRDTAKMYQKKLAKIKDPVERDHRLIQLNVIRQIDRLAENPSVTAAWERGQRLDLNGWVYDITTGQIEDLGVTKHKA